MNGWFGGSVFPVALGVFAGANLTFQALVNSQLRAIIGSSLRASLVSYVGGTLCCIAIILARRESLNVFDRHFQPSNAIFWTGGLYGLLYLALTVWLLPRIASTQLFALIVAGQLLAALVFDQFGLFGNVARPIDLSRFAGVALLVFAVYLIRR